MSVERVKIGAKGRIVIPAAYRQALGVEPGDEVVLCLEDGEVRVRPVDSAVKRAQRMFRERVPSGRRLADDLIEDREAEAARE